MTFTPRLSKLAFSALLAAAAAGSASAANQRSFVASYGLDSNPCNLAAPCRGFAQAMAQTLTSGEVIVLDSAGYGPVTVSQPVSIIAPPGVYAGISVFSLSGITVNAPGAKVTLRGLTINGLGGINGVSVTAVGTLYLDRVAISGFSTGLNVAMSTTATINVLQSSFRDNGTGAVFATTAGPLSVTVDGSVFERNTTAGATFGANTAGAIVSSLLSGGAAGVNVNPGSGTAKVEIRDSNVNDNTGNGVFAGGSGATASVVSSVVSGNNVGLQATGAGNEVYASDSTITRNVTGVNATSSGTTRSGQDNRLVNNTSNGVFTQNTPKI